MINDTDRLNWLEAQNSKNSYTGKCNFRWSTTGRGWRLIETSGGPNMEPTFSTVREAIDYAMGQVSTKEHFDHGPSPYDAGVGPLNENTYKKYHEGENH
jgi:hypothetical protein